ncbi:antibiotic biosynthesis monooxygenase [Prosthecodimorpha staleyi]|uniref:Antibiotic biosynthesis monooxygenase n=1 Tax=Prosthecodimorpha staleyi TaxID=2840188 RepID=A0A947D6L8_9HYPH|nr:antibiotic biosynthesis monooxygenase [Prosthecodimorpha staleyi]MBT9292035.1 antibiotic biosynthesis monooxygenase [Prosthecodimorpha staleyi]
MTAFNVVRFKTKPGMEREFIDAHTNASMDVKGFRRFSLISTGPAAFCVIGEWDDLDSLAAARPTMIGLLNSFRHTLEDLGNGLGVTDPVSGPALLELRP